LVECIDLLQLSRGKGVREGRLIKVKRVEERRETGAHRRWRISPGMLADLRRYDEEFPGFGGVSCRRTKGRWRRSVGAFYRRGESSKRAGLMRD
jgi:hypothetical protein